MMARMAAFYLQWVVVQGKEVAWDMGISVQKPVCDYRCGLVDVVMACVDRLMRTCVHMQFSISVRD